MSAPPASTGLRLLHLPNERSKALDKRQVSARKAFEWMHDTGVLDRYDVFSFLLEAERPGGTQAARQRLLALAEEVQPDLLFWQHNTEFDVSPAFLKQLKGVSSRPKLVYHDEDPYGHYIKPMPGPMRTLLAASDLAFLGGTGAFFDLARKYGATDVCFAPHCFDAIRYGRPWTPTTQREVDIVMIANFGATRIPGRLFPGAGKRRRLVDALTDEWGARFALYGSGWGDRVSARGRAPFLDQEKAIRTGWVSVNWDHFDHVPFYHSNRLPISLAAGVPHVTSRHQGYNILFGDCPSLFCVDSVGEAVDVVRYLLSLPPSRLNALGQAGRDFAYAHLEANGVYLDILRTCTHRLFGAEIDAGSPARIRNEPEEPEEATRSFVHHTNRD